MSQLSLSLDSSLLVRDDQGRYLMATADQILEAARQIIDQKTRRGASFTSPRDVRDYLKAIFAGAALTTLLGVGAELAAPENRQNGDRVIIAGRDSAQDSINQVGQEMTRRNMNIQPTLTERPGLPVRIIANRDLVLLPYQPLFFNKGTSR
ncbi:type IV secretory pathway VirB10-like protein [Luteibacter sp. PvP120]